MEGGACMSHIPPHLTLKIVYVSLKYLVKFDQPRAASGHTISLIRPHEHCALQCCACTQRSKQSSFMHYKTERAIRGRGEIKDML